MNTVFIIGIFLSFFLAVLLFSKKNKNLPDSILAIWLSIIGIHLFNYFCYYRDYWKIYPHLVGLTAPLPLLYGPLLYLYTAYSLKNRASLNLKDYLHFGPFILSYLYLIPFFFGYTGNEKIKVYQGQLSDYGSFSNLLIVLFILSGISYALISYRLVNRQRHLVDANFSCNKDLSLAWLNNSILGIALIFITVSIIVFLRNVLGIHFHFNADFILYTMIVAFVLRIGFFGIRQQNIFANSSENNEQLIFPSNSSKTYERSGLKPEVAAIAHQKLLSLMECHKPYLNPKLSLSNLAKQMDLSPNHLSQLINQYEKVNFNDFVNRYRLNEFIKRAGANHQYSLLANAIDSGFNSKSSFNHVFKKFTGTTPSQYLAHHHH